MDKEHVKVADPLPAEYERGFIDGMKMQAQRAADRNDMYVAGWNEAISGVIKKVVITMSQPELLGNATALLATIRSRLEGMKK